MSRAGTVPGLFPAAQVGLHRGTADVLIVTRPGRLFPAAEVGLHRGEDYPYNRVVIDANSFRPPRSDSIAAAVLVGGMTACVTLFPAAEVGLHRGAFPGVMISVMNPALPAAEVGLHRGGLSLLATAESIGQALLRRG